MNEEWFRTKYDAAKKELLDQTVNMLRTAGEKGVRTLEQVAGNDEITVLPLTRFAVGIFDAFMTTKEKGMGIGLAVSRTIVEADGGRLWAENNTAGSASFNVALPSGQADSVTA